MRRPFTLPSNWKTILDAVTSVVLIAAAVTLLWWNWPGRRPSAQEPDVPADPVSIADAAAKGSPLAKAVLIVFSDFQCPFCGRFARNTLPTIEHDYVKSDRLQLVYRNLPLVDQHPHAMRAAQAAECAGRQGQFWEMHDRLFAEGTQLDGPGLEAVAMSLDLERSAYAGCLNEESSRAAVSRDAELAKSLGLQSTPAFLLGSRTSDGRVQVSRAFYGAQPLESFRSEIDRVLTPGNSSWFGGLFGLLTGIR